MCPIINLNQKVKQMHTLKLSINFRIYIHYDNSNYTQAWHFNRTQRNLKLHESKP